MEALAALGHPHPRRSGDVLRLQTDARSSSQAARQLPVVETPAYQGSSGHSPCVACRPLLVFVRLSSERVRQAVRQDCSFVKKQESPPALLVVVV